MPIPDDAGQLGRVAAAFRALGHPTRLQILDALNRETELSPTQLVDRLSTTPGLANVAYHTRELAGLGLLSPAGLRPARGALEDFYRLSSHGQEFLEMVDGLSVNTSVA